MNTVSRIPDWGTRLHLEQEIDAEITHIGLHAHGFIGVGRKREDNCIPVKEKGRGKNFHLNGNIS